MREITTVPASKQTPKSRVKKAPTICGWLVAPIRQLFIAVIAVGMFGAPLLTAPAFAATPTTATLTITVRDGIAGRQDAVQVTNLNNDLLGTCQLNGSVRRTTCGIQVPTDKSVVLSAQPGAGGRSIAWLGSGCGSAPGPVCHIAVNTANQAVTAWFGTARPVPTITTAKPLVYAGSPTLSLAGIGYGGYDTVQTTGNGFAPNAAATLTDNGVVVANGTTDGSGAVNLSYTAASEPGIYRKLAIHAGSKTATTDVYNTLVWSWGEGNQGSGQPSFVVNETNMDANTVENYVQFNSNAPVPITFTDGNAAQGYAQVTTPAYSCAAGTSGTLSIYGTRGMGVQRYTYRFTFSVTC